MCICNCILYDYDVSSLLANSIIIISSHAKGAREEERKRNVEFHLLPLNSGYAVHNDRHCHLLVMFVFMKLAAVMKHVSTIIRLKSAHLERERELKVK